MAACLWLVKNGVPYDVALSMDEIELAAHTIVFGECEGNVWSWDSMAWKTRP